MIDEATLERRLSALEQAVADVRLGLTNPTPTGNWLEAVAGSISDEAAFLKALEYGRAIRETDQQGDEHTESGEGP